MGNLYRHQRPLLDADAGLFQTTSGTAFQLRTSTSDDRPDHLQTFAVVFETEAADGTVAPSVQTSWDGERWLEVATGPGKAGVKSMKASVLGRYVRAMVRIEAEGTFSGAVRLISDRPFRLV
jgi:hypothetical protein